MGHTNVVQHKIDTGDSRPIRQYPRRLPFAYREETSKQVAEMLDQGVIQASSSPWASPIVLVKKKDGTFRFCIDYAQRSVRNWLPIMTTLSCVLFLSARG